jgi:hypothetical protein
MRPRAVLGGGVLLVLLVAAVVLLRAHAPAPAAPAPVDTTAPPAPVLTPLPVVDARARRLTADFVTTTALPATVRFAPGASGTFEFIRYADDTPGGSGERYEADGDLRRASDGAVLDQVRITLLPPGPSRADRSVACDPTGGGDGRSCTARAFPDGTRATVVRNPVFAQAVATDATSGAPPGTQTVLRAALPKGTLLTVTVSALGTAGIPLDDAAMLALAGVPGLES